MGVLEWCIGFASLNCMMSNFCGGKDTVKVQKYFKIQTWQVEGNHYLSSVNILALHADRSL